MTEQTTKSPAEAAGDFTTGDDLWRGVSSTDSPFTTTATIWQVPVTTAQVVDRPGTHLVVRDLRGERYFRIDNEFMSRGIARHVGPFGLAIYAALCYHGNRTSHAYPSYATLADECGMSRRQAIREIAKLERLRLVNVERRTNDKGDPSTCLVTLLDKSEWLDCESLSPSDCESLPPSDSQSPRSDSQSPKQESGDKNQLPPTSQSPKDDAPSGGGDPLLPEEVAAVRDLIDLYVPDLNRIEELLRRYPPAILGPAILVTRRMKLDNPAGYLFMRAGEVHVTDKDRADWHECVAAHAAGQTWRPKGKEAKAAGGMTLADWSKRNGRAS